LQCINNAYSKFISLIIIIVIIVIVDILLISSILLMHDHGHEDLDKIGRLDWHVDSVVTCVNRVQWLQTCFSCMDVEEEQL